MTAEVAATPQRVRRSDGTFVPIDTTLHRADGLIAPRATLADVKLSDGGEAPLVVVARDGGTVALSWHQALPVPVLSGDTAVYSNVPIQDVDLHIRVDAQGAAAIFVVKTRQAAADSALRQLTFGLSTNLEATADSEGRVSWTDDSGQAVFVTGRAAMWDSKTRLAAPQTSNGVRNDDTPGLWSPGEAAATSGVPLQITDHALTLTPDTAFLADPDLVFPVVIDPTVSRTNWAMINSRYTTTCYVMCNGYDDDDHMKVGWTTDDGGMWYRSMVSFSRSSFANKHVLDAKLESYLLHSWNLIDYTCTNTSTYVHSTAVFSSSTTWSNHSSSWSGSLGSTPAMSNCSGATNVRAEWGGAGLTSHVNTRAATGDVYLGLAATDKRSWNKFDENRTRLIVTYNSVPTVPTNLQTFNQAVGVVGLPCSSGPERLLVRSLTPTVKAKANDADVETDLRIRFTFQRWAGSAWSDLGAEVENSVNLTNNDLGAFTIPASWGLAHGDRIQWRAVTRDPWSYGGSSGSDISPPSVWCEFEIDSTPPDSPPGVSSPVYLEYEAGLNEDYHGGVGRTAEFTFTAGGVSDVVGWYWGWVNPPSTYLAAEAPGQSMTISLTPPPPYPHEPSTNGTLTLYVRSIDGTRLADGDNSLRQYIMRVGGSSDAVAQWNMAETTGSVLADSNQLGIAAHDITVAGTTLGVPGRIAGGETAVQFDGVDDNGSTSGPVVDTAGSYTVSAWVKPVVDGGWSTVLSQRGTNVSGMILQLEQGTNKWALSGHVSDTNAPVTVRATSVNAARTGAWTHVVGVYDSGAAQLRLYVDGVLQQAVPYTSWSAAGSFVLGAEWHQGAYTSRFGGSLAEVKVWDQVLVSDQIARMAATHLAWWPMEGDGRDDSNYGRDLTPSGAVTFGPGKVGQAAHINGIAGGELTSGSTGGALRTDQSYTVAAWVKLDSMPTDNMVAVGQVGACTTAVNLGVVRVSPGNFRWGLGGRSTDCDANPTWPNASAGTNLTSTDINQWVYLVGVQDAPNRQLRIYVNGVRSGTVTFPTPWAAPGQVRIGSMSFWGVRGSAFNGTVDEVQVFQGVLPDSEIMELYQP
ncbi:LamG domain-containing protein [Polymorphospora rubra]|uniref:LamG-like jellyroll fold domain-containing protein n=2 Tax=Polymorphospora rubra TaxID=338584 RepID=A0A810N9S8_9ACTN|nr:hypothetical protein Prubr_74430 [Polymorphospora rubra]